ncbi:cytochrome P450 3A24 [Podospora conica]|nr:cytochrome P450 3A24 [Schizothecium conicum]
MEYSIHLAVAFGLLSGLYYLYTLTLPRPLGDIPYERQNVHRPFGDMPSIVRRSKENGALSVAMFDIARRLNTPIAQVLTPGFVPPFLVLNDPREVEDILLRRNREFDRSPTTTRLFAPIVPRSTLAQLTTPALRAQKRLWADAMNADFLRRVVAPNIHLAALDLIELWTLKASLAPSSAPIPVSHDFNHAALDAIWVAVLGSHPGITRAHIAALSPLPTTPPSESVLAARRSAAVIEAAMESAHTLVHAAMNSILSRLTILRLRLSPTFRRFSATLDAEIRRLMTDAVARLSHPDTADTCAMDLVLRRALRQVPAPPDPAADPAMLQELLLLLMAGHDSTANTLAWFVKLMASHQAAQARLRAAVRACPAGLDAAGILDASVPYLDAVIEETARVSGTAAAVARQAVVDTTVLGYRVPKGTNVLLSTHLVDEGVVGRVVEEGVRSATSRGAQGRRVRGGLEGEAGRGLAGFRPERWLVTGEDGEEVFDGNALPGLIFGGGLRGCFGKRLAMQELRIFIFHLMYNFEFLPLPEELQDMSAQERIFRQPNMCHVRLKKL